MVSTVVVSLFDGISGARVALDRVKSMRVVRYYSSEILPNAIKIANYNYPQDEKYRLGDVTKIDFVALREEIKAEFPNAEILLIGGSPCQGFSMAGKKKGASTKCGINITTYEQYQQLVGSGFTFDGQSWLIWEFIRAKKELTPDIFLLENVRVQKKWLPDFNRALGVAPIEINSNLVSAQNRIRFYWTNLYATKPIDKKIMFRNIIEEHPFRELKPFMLGKYCGKLRLYSAKDITCDKFFTVTTKNTHTGMYLLNRRRDMMRTLSVTEYEKLQTLPVGYCSNTGVSNTHCYHGIGNGFTIDVVAHILKQEKTLF